jgi:hypothetical protein
MFSISQSLPRIKVYFLFFYFTRFDAAFLHITAMKIHIFYLRAVTIAFILKQQNKKGLSISGQYAEML